MSETDRNSDYDEFVKLFVRYEPGDRGLVRSLVQSLQDADDVMQEVGLVCWRKFGDFESDATPDGFFRWACVVARFDRLVLSEETIRLLATDAVDRARVAEAERQAMEDCLQNLPPPERRLLMSVHTRGDSVAQIAMQLGQDARRLYRKVNALRDVLSETRSTRRLAG